MVRTIPLTQGKLALVDDDLYEYLCQWKWYYNNGYALAYDKETKRAIRMHRFITTPLDSEVVDHINHNTLDNRRENLRVCTQAENCQNRSDHNESTGKGFLLTVIIDADIFWLSKSRAALQGKTLAKFVEDVLRKEVVESPKE